MTRMKKYAVVLVAGVAIGLFWRRGPGAARPWAIVRTTAPQPRPTGTLLRATRLGMTSPVLRTRALARDCLRLRGAKGRGILAMTARERRQAPEDTVAIVVPMPTIRESCLRRPRWAGTPIPVSAAVQERSEWAPGRAGEWGWGRAGV